jgi:hypothetical protein
MIPCKSKYYRARLKATEAKSVYDTILTALENQQTEVLLENKLLSQINYSLDSMVMYVRMDNPGLFYADFQQFHYLHSSTHSKIVFPYLYPTNKIASVERQIKDKINAISSTISSADLVEMEYAIHDWLVANVTFEHKDMNYHKAHSAVGALLHGRAVCEGYAMAFKLLCDSVGISNIVVYGTAINLAGKRENHAWNIVKINDKCYHIDVTWDSCMRSDDRKCHSHLNITDTDTAQDHTWNRGVYPKCEATQDNYFIRNRLFFRNKEELRTHLTAGIKRGQRSFEVKYAMKLANEMEIGAIIQSAMQGSMQGFVKTMFLGGSYQIQLNKERGVAQISII